MTGEPPQARLRIRNHGDRLLELRLEHYGEDYWLKPNEEAVFTTLGFEGPSPWSVMTGPGEPFDVDYYPAMVVVNFNGAQAWATDPAGNILCCGHQRPEPPPA